MIIKYFDEFNGVWADVSGDTGSVLLKGTDNWTTSAGFTRLVLLISQSGTDDPTSTELENTIGTNYTLTRVGQGQYAITLDDGLLSQGKTWLNIQQSDSSIIQIYRDDVYTIKIRPTDDNILNFTSFELRIYG